MGALVRARRSFFAASRQMVPAGQIRRDDDPLVKDRADLFEPVEDSVVEQATAAPGEKRQTTSSSEVACPVDGCDYVGSERGLKVHARSHDDED